MQQRSKEELAAADKRHIWHPFTQHKVWDEEDILIVERAEGNDLIDVHGKRYLDGISALWCNVHGYAEPRLLEVLHRQADTLCHTTLLGGTHRPIIELTEALLEKLPKPLTRVFYSDGGSVAVESALRMALEYWQKQEYPSAKKRRKFLSLASAYHGDTLGSLGVGYREELHRSLDSVLVTSLQVAAPHLLRFYEGMSEAQALAQSIAALESVFAKEGEQLAAFVLEPMVQGAAGIWPQPPEFLQAVERLCRQHGVLLICDEIATGFGKTSAFFAVELAGVQPDLMTIGKGLTAGYMPMAAVAATEEIFRGFYAEPQEMKTFYFGQTFSGNPLAAAVAKASLDLFEENNVLARVEQGTQTLQKLLQEQVQPLAHVDEVRQCGYMVGIELTEKPGEHQPYPIAALAGHRCTLEARARGLIIRPLGNVLVLMPSLSMNDQQLERLVSITAESIAVTLGAE